MKIGKYFYDLRDRSYFNNLQKHANDDVPAFKRLQIGLWILITSNIKNEIAHGIKYEDW